MENNYKQTDGFKRIYLKKYHIENVDLQKEFELIQQKKSMLSRSQRDAVVAAVQLFNLIDESNKNEIEDIPVGDPLTKDEADQAIANVQNESVEQSKEN